MNTEEIKRILFLARLKGEPADLGRIHIADEKALLELLTDSGTLKKAHKLYYVRHPFEFEWYGGMPSRPSGRKSFESGLYVTVGFFRGMQAHTPTRSRPPR